MFLFWHYRTKNKTVILLAVVLLTSFVAFVGILASATTTQVAYAQSSDTGIPLKEAKLIIEHNVKDKDTGFQGFLDGEGRNNITITGPSGKVLNIKCQGKLGLS
jgi:hypothetical protein